MLETPEAILSVLLDIYSGYLEEEITQNERDDLTPQKQAEIKSRCRWLRENAW